MTGAPGAVELYSWRRDPSVPAFPDDRPVVVFDGMCAMCSGFARFILRAGRRKHIRLMAAQSAAGVALYRHLGLDPVRYETNILLADGRVWLKSEGSLRIFGLLGFPWCLAGVARLIPVAVRDRLYEIVARNRLRWFGTRAVCYRPDPGDADRFIA